MKQMLDSLPYLHYASGVVVGGSGNDATNVATDTHFLNYVIAANTAAATAATPFSPIRKKILAK